mgnify:CR=1 FL=1
MKIGIDLGGSHIGIGLLNNDNRIVNKIEKDIDEIGRYEKQILKFIDEQIEILKKNNRIDLIGIATPGNIKGDCMENLVNLGIKRLDFSGLIEKNKDIIFQINNDSKAAGVAEMEYGALRKYKDAVFLCLGTGIGSAVFLNGKLLKANKNIGFELGHMIIDKNGLKCNCGKRGCFETYCSIKRFKENIANILNLKESSSEEIKEILEKMMITDKNGKDSILINLLGNEPSIVYGKLCISEQDVLRVREVVEQYISDLIIGLSNIIEIFEPEAICLGGSFVFFKNIFYNKLVEEMNKRKYVFNKDNLPKIILAELKNDAGIIGAVVSVKYLRGKLG